MTQVVDRWNLALLILAGFLAIIFPLEVLLISYAFLGPLHYLTEISWLHDRKYFTIRSLDPYILSVTSLVILFVGAAIIPAMAELVWLLLLLAFCMAFVKRWTVRALILSVGALCLYPVIGTAESYALSILIPTVLHVFLFTALFMLFGALKAKSMLGVCNTFLFVLISIILLFIPFEPSVLSNFVQTNYPFLLI